MQVTNQRGAGSLAQQEVDNDTVQCIAHELQELLQSKHLHVHSIVEHHSVSHHYRALPQQAFQDEIM